ncbi:arthrodial cuticle protein AMP8.1 [Penaeus vannamei]|uniref:Arthrodial cuticle protein AMP8.1 n=1 Tax=Penaeus vannamei TaxID=6689 RepID=A0A423TYG1_PENVA|nr:arthrodial cuticle protein AMP8.1 [Penaeus vannamei]
MKLIVLACLAAVAVAAKLEDRVVTLLRDDRVANEDGTFSYAVQADNGINTAVEGVVGSAEQRYIKVVFDVGCYHWSPGLPRINNMKLIVLACLAAVAVAAKLEDRVVTLLRDDRVANEDGTFSYAVQADNGINTAVEGVVGSAEQRYIKVVFDVGCYHWSPGLPRINNMKLIVLACLAAVAVAAKLEDRVVTLLRDDRVANEDGTFSYAVQADNGINTAVEGVVGSAGQINHQGSYT